MKTFYFLIGLPRSGSTVLSSILNQHPDVFVTPTSPLLDLLIALQTEWHRCPSVQANPIPEQLTQIVQAVIESAWSHRPEPIIVDRCRGWAKNLPPSTILFKKEIKCIMTVRDLPSIMASWLLIMEKNPGNYMDIELNKRNLPVTRETRVMGMWHNMVKDCMEGIQCARKDAGDRIYTVDYARFIDNPIPILDEISSFLNISNFSYDLDSIVNDYVDDDLKAWGMAGLHTIRPKLEKTAKHPQEILGERLYNTFVEFERQYTTD